MIKRDGPVIGKRDIARQIAASVGIAAETAEDCITAFLDSVCRAVGAGSMVQIRNFGTFRPRIVPEKAASTLIRGETMIPSSIRFSFKAARSIATLKPGDVRFRPVDRSYQRKRRDERAA